MVQIIPIGEDSHVSLFGNLGQGFRTTPALHNHVCGEFRMKDLIPSHHLFPMFFYDGLDAFVEISLQVMIVLHPMLLFEGADIRIGVPMFTVDLISADMKIVIRKQPGHLADKDV